MLLPIALIIAACNGASEVAYTAENTSGDGAVFIVDVDRPEPRQIGPHGIVGPPVWSTDGTRIAFASESASGRGIYVANAEVGDGRYLTYPADSNDAGINSEAFGDPAFSIDGARIAFRAHAGTAARIVVWDFAANTAATWGGDATGLYQPAWLPEADMVVQLLMPFLEEGDAGRELAIAPDASLLFALQLADGTTNPVIVFPDHVIPFPEAALPSPGRYAELNLSLDLRTRSLAFESNDGGDREIFIASFQGTYDVSNHRAADWNPVWQPGGLWIAFESFRSGRRGIYRAHRATYRVQPVVVDAAADCWGPTWTADGKTMVYVTDRAGHADLYVASGDGTKARPLAATAAWEDAPAWRPVQR